MLTTAAWSHLPRPGWTLPPLTTAVALYIPQFAASQPLRVAHGLLMAAGCILLTAGISAQRRRANPSDNPEQVPEHKFIRAGRIRTPPCGRHRYRARWSQRA
ncbi:hypothetical protein [Arthrobacter sp. M4]|uniref:hypothetical protein n=1 Tax=Arthrobacter sp. M4 TaxID=218160 RepID=UPI001CDBD35C|nr:hypothetical protein [Arthrobacter sp. M4]MCA4131762.1 hypothetical protein [Arthrobacter sp. M4]